jgi:hypothetical protein
VTVDEPQLKFVSGSAEDRLSHVEALIYHLYGHLSELEREAMRSVKVNPQQPADEGKK